MRKSFFLLVSFFVYVSMTPLCAQDLEGLLDRFTKEDVIEKLGQPIEYRSEDLNDPTPTSFYQELRYDGCIVRILDNFLHSYEVTSSEYRVLTEYLEDGIRVGDSEEKLLKAFENIPLLIPYQRDPLKKGENMLRFLIRYDDHPIHFFIENNCIVKITSSITD